ncbi:hypothetical protein COLU111180_12190 [Cohnella lubricantis]|uniref:hypothetical protein n=1 Tax=Cohnella lubricantis TaxID=2163172 RepID=UPI001FDAC7EC|nr:hypothetical protein [Cohnella lubricantis]MBP2117943.1 hypothetical protein [Cohnella lubricantis]
MSKTTLNVLFKKMQKDDKKEVLVFQVNGDELESAQTLVELAGGIVTMDIEGCDAGEIMAEFASLQRDSKKTALKFHIKGDSEEKAIPLYRFAGRNVTLNLQASQMSIDYYYGDDPREGVEYTVDGDGAVRVNDDPDQVTIDGVTYEVGVDLGQEPEDGVGTEPEWPDEDDLPM